jgi:hypothetical protein
MRNPPFSASTHGGLRRAAANPPYGTCGSGLSVDRLNTPQGHVPRRPGRCIPPP